MNVDHIRNDIGPNKSNEMTSDEFNSRRLKIDRYLQYLFIRVKSNLLSRSEILQISAQKISNSPEIDRIHGKVFENSPIRHTYNEDEIFETWFQLISKSNNSRENVTKYDNNVTMFSASLFAIGQLTQAKRSQSKVNSPPEDILLTLNEMGFRRGISNS
jgi:hypothetical protein